MFEIAEKVGQEHLDIITGKIQGDRNVDCTGCIDNFRQLHRQRKNFSGGTVGWFNLHCCNMSHLGRIAHAIGNACRCVSGTVWGNARIEMFHFDVLKFDTQPQNSVQVTKCMFLEKYFGRALKAQGFEFIAQLFFE